MLRLEDQSVVDDDLLDWLRNPHKTLHIKLRDQCKTVEWIAAHELESQLGFIAHPSKLNKTNV